jgi:hypothetical protein
LFVGIPTSSPAFVAGLRGLNLSVNANRLLCRRRKLLISPSVELLEPLGVPIREEHWLEPELKHQHSDRRDSDERPKSNASHED